MTNDTALNLESGTVSPLTINFGPSTPKGAQAYSITLIAQSGLEAVAQKTVTLNVDGLGAKPPDHPPRTIV